jgi:transcriptional regulator with XRE-family HTH domain
MNRFPDNLNRLLGLHSLSAREAAQMLDLSPSTFAKWGTGLRQPSFATALRVGEFFGLPADRLATAEFEDLLEHELADAGRFKAVEGKIRDERVRLQAARDLERGVEIDVVTGKPVENEDVR